MVVVCLTVILDVWHTIASSASYTATTKQDWETGTLTNIDYDSIPGDIKIGQSGNHSARNWKTPPDTFGVGSAFVSSGDYIYALRGNYENDFFRYNSINNSWEQLADAPTSAANNSSLAVASNGDIYAVFGRDTRTFAKYTPSQNTWTNLSDTPSRTGSGTTILHVDGKIYVFRGAGTQDFWMYDVGTGEWATLGQPPYTINTVNASAYDGTDYIYVARGTNQRHIMRYSISGKSWATMTTLYPIAINEQTTMEYRDGNLFIAQPNSTNLYKCEINDLACTGDTWSALKTLPATYRYGASIYHAKDGYLYIFRGNSTYDFWKYNIAENRYVGLDVFPQSFTTGGDLIWDGATHLYGFKGGAATSGFYYYDLTNGGWTSRSVTNLIGLSTDNKYVKAGNLIYVISGANFRSYDTTNDSGNWITLTSPPASFNTGSSLVYPGSGDYIYGIQGGSSNFYTYHITNGNWTTLDPANPPSIAANVGARVVTDGTSIFFNPGYGNTRFYKYDIGDDQWSEVAPIPSGAYSGADMSYYNGKVYTLTGTYRNHFFSYDIADNRWDHLETFQLREFTDKGSWSGASIEYIGDNTFAIAPGTGQDIYTYAVGSDEYENEAIYESQSIDLTYVTSWQNIVVDSEEEEGTSVKVETQSSLDGSSWTGYEEIVGDEIQSDPGRYIQTKITLSSNETHDKTPTVHAYTINYTPDDVKPNNPSAESFVGKSAVDGETISSGQTHNHLHPEFSWDPGTDNESGISGYYVYFGPNSEANPEEVGSFQAETSYEVNSAISTGDNFLLIKTKDVKGNVSDTVTLGFTYKFNGVSPSSPTTIATSNDFNAGNLDKITVANDSISLTHRNGFWNQTSLTAPTAAFGAGAGVVYKPSTNKLYAIRGGNSSNFWSYNIESNSWETLSSTNLPTINYGGGLVDGPGNYIYAWRGTVTNSFYRYDITDNDAGWSDADAADVPAAVSYGGSMVYDGNRYIYALKGVGDTFYRFDTQAEGGGEWTTLEVVDFGSQVPNNTVTDGGRIAFDGNDTIYATLGGSNAGGFAKYSILDKTWTPLGCLPDAPATGADISWDSASGSLYYINAYVRGEIYKYNPATAKWTTLTAAPTTFTTGTKMAKVDDYFYVSRGGGAGLYRYHTIKNSWEVPTFNLFGPNVYGTTNFTTGFGSTVLQGNSNYLYLSRGNFDDSFIRYDYVTGESLQLARLPVGAYQGADLTYDEDRGDIYYITGNNTTATLHKYSITTDTWSEVTTDVPPITPGYGSSLAYDGSQYIYYVRGNNSTSWYRYDINANAGSRWSGILPTANLAGIGHGSKLAIYDGYAYALRGQSVNPNPFYRFRLSDLPDGSWEVLSPLPNLVSYDGFLIAGNNGKLYAHRASNYQEFYEYDINAENWTEIEKSPAKFYQGSAGGGNKTNQIFAVSGNGTGAYQDGLYSFVYQTDSSAYEEEGSYTSQDFDLTAVYDWANITLSMVEASNTSLKIGIIAKSRVCANL